MGDLDFNLTDSAAVRQFGQWLNHRGYTEIWHAYDPKVRAEYSAALRVDDTTIDEIERVMSDPYFGVPA